MHGFLEYVMRSRKQATLIALLFVFVPFFGWVSSAIMALVTLQIGIRDGFLLFLWVLLANVVAKWLGYPVNLLLDVLGGALLSWVLAVILRVTVSWRTVILSAVVIGLTGICLIHWFIPDLQVWWTARFSKALTAADQLGLLNVPVQTAMAAFKPLSYIATGLAAVFIILSVLFNLSIARWWQALLYNPGGFRSEMYQLHLDKLSAIGILTITGLLFIDNQLGWDCLPVILLPFVLVGLALVHMFLAKTANSRFWLVSFYGVLILIFPYVAVFLALVALLDSGIDIRKRLVKG